MSTLAVRPAPPPARVAPAGRRARLDSRVRFGSGIALWAALLPVTWWWAAGGGLRDLGGWASGLTSAGRLTGLVASVLLLVQVLLMARVPVLERAFGQDGLAAVHRTVGFVSFTGMLAHIGLVTWGYAAGDLFATPGTLWDLTWDTPGMLLAAAGTACLVLVVVTSVRAARVRLRYESWHLLHLYAYLGAGLALPHQLWTGQEFTASTARTVFWWGLWGAALGAVLLWRVALPVARSVRHRIVVTAIVPEGDGSVSVHLAGHRLHALGARAGQFLTWRFLTGSGWTRGHPYSLSAAPDGRALRITVKDLGDGSAAVAGLRPGTRVLVEGPFGRLTAHARTAPDVLLIGAGVGITPLRALVEEFVHDPAGPGRITLVHRFADEPLFARELTALSAGGRCELVPVAGPRRRDDSWLGHAVGPGDDLAALRARVPDLAHRDVYVCGPTPWTALVVRTLAAGGVPADRVHVEHFGW
ncbi:ferric reductase-like transmembrane domain-containing protein [Pseudonocardia sp. ICBG162]|uniref:ferredoxin reductase family protein n=1 Tax=Pseudonocardia sp. ICBG162 TaxID=2846761 RepID=UPI001CF619E2|nr:ferredoxin reductase family protein [Pseudonocardia sp. ICBG162]